MRNIFFCIFFTGVVFGQSNPTLYVASPKGLSLREGPSKESKKIELLPYGKEISNYVIPEGKFTTIDGYNGKWINLLSNEGKSYYVFDGYSLPFEPPSGGKLLTYFTRVFGEITSTDSVIKTGPYDDHEVSHTYHFSSGVVFTDAVYYEAYGCTLENLDLSVQKAYLLYYLIVDKMEYGERMLTKIDYPTKTFNSDTLSIEFNKKNVGDLFIEHAYGAVGYLIISSKNGKRTIAWGAGV